MYRWRLALLALVAALLIASLAWAQAEPPATNDPAPAADEMPAAQDEAVAEQPAAVEPAAAEPVVPVVEEHPAAVVTEHAAAEHEAAGGHGEGEKKEEEHWTLFGYIPVGWTIPIAQTVAGWFGWHVDPHQFTAHGLLHVEFLSRHQFQLGKGRLQRRMEVLFHLRLKLAKAGWQRFRKAFGPIIKSFGVDHRRFSAWELPSL